MTDRETGPSRRARFRTQPRATLAAKDPEELLGILPRTSANVGPLWSHQADQLRIYAESHAQSPDVALELPTGSGKTLVGLLIAEWKRASIGHRVVYACPTKQLAQQVVTKARDEGIDARALHGPSKLWDSGDQAACTMGHSVAVTTYSAIFNINSRFAEAQTILFDDAHSAENYVAEAWALSVMRDDPQYEQLFDAFGDKLEPALVSRMMSAEGPSTDRSEVRLIPVSAVADRASDLDAILNGLVGDASYRFKMIRQNLASCLVYVSRQQFYIRPMIPPTFQHGPFVDPEQRIYLSATLGDAGELERAFGRQRIERVPVPPAWEKTGAGRRFFVFPDLAQVDGMDGDEGPDPKPPLAKLMGLAGKQVILTPDEGSATRIADELEVPAEERFDAKDPATGIDTFLAAPKGTLLAPNRYDGMDVKDEACRLLLVDGLPTGTHLQDKFLATKLRAKHVLEERTRTRIIQGLGRCTRGPKDWSLVIVSGDDLLNFVGRSEFLNSLAPHLRAEIAFGLLQSHLPVGELVQLSESALAQDEIWREEAEPALVDMRHSYTRKPVEAEEVLAKTAPREVRCWEYVWQQNWVRAATEALSIAEALTVSELRSYRSLWLYLASAWFGLASQSPGDSESLRATQLLEQAHLVAKGTTWLKETARLEAVVPEFEPWDTCAIDAALSLVRGALKSGTAFERRAGEMLDNLNSTDAKKFEPGAVQLGKFLGAESYKPDGQGRADAAWIWDDLWITVEAKSEQLGDGPISMNYVKQTNTHLKSLASDRSLDDAPQASLSVIASPRRVVDPDAVPIAESHVYVIAPTKILDIAHDARRAWTSIRALAQDDDDDLMRGQIGRYLWEHRVLPTQVRERLSEYQVNSV